MTPKFHFLIHYPKLIAQYGPLKYIWYMRFEAKHQYFKKLASVGKNFKNIDHTLAKQHQVKQCWEFTSIDFLKDDILCSGENSIIFCNLMQQHLVLFYYNLTNISLNELLWKCTVLTLAGKTFKVNEVAIINLLHTEKVPLFFKITQMLKLQESWFFIGKIFVAHHFSAHLHAYCRKEESF